MSFAKLRGKIKEVYGTNEAFAKAMNKDPSTISLKLNGRSSWTREEMEIALILLGVPAQEIYNYFFKH